MQKLKKAWLPLTVALLLIGGSIASVNAQAIVRNSTVTQSKITSKRVAVPAGSTTVQLDNPSRHITIYNETGGALLHVSWANTTATTSHAAVPAGVGIELEFVYPVEAIKVIGASPSGNFDLVAY